MATVKTPDGKTIEVTSGGALRYYEREPGYEIVDDETAEVAEEQPSTSGRGRRQAASAVPAEAPQTDAVEPVTT